MKVAVIDNYDSFTYNLVQYLAELGAETAVHRNDEVEVGELAEADAVVISPGPGAPPEAGVSLAAVRELSGRLPILGVCLGHQCIGEAFGGRVVRGRPVHGQTSQVHHLGDGLFQGLPDPFEATRYHSLMVERESLPAELEVTAWTADGIVMGLRHRAHPTFGVQFHPESILTRCGMDILRNFVSARVASPPYPPQRGRESHGPALASPEGRESHGPSLASPEGRV
ncbi:MAG TPA: aminodeoxychorismate/anthranilate synthase component II [Candidatus Acidoferrales bacterium]|nr:aminodeoxychorismate/anthranilate synthase component II [Candidatus Acidoferrales bacterium]